MSCAKKCIAAGAVLMAMLCAAAAAADAARAQSAFDGSWRISPAQTRFSTRPFTFYTSRGWYHCVSCVPALDIQADGRDHPVQGHEYDSFSVTLVDARTIKNVAKKNGRTLWVVTNSLSAGGTTLTETYTSYPMNGGEPINEVETYRRVGTLPAGVHATSGNWQQLKFTGSENDLVFTCRISGDQFTMMDPAGDSYTARFDGKDYPYKGSYDTDAVSLKRIDARTIEETDKLNGKVQDTQRMIVAQNGKSMRIEVHDALRGVTSTFTATRKSR